MAVPPPGETYRLTADGYHYDRRAGAHLVMALRERLELRVPE